MKQVTPGRLTLLYRILQGQREREKVTWQEKKMVTDQAEAAPQEHKRTADRADRLQPR